MEEAVQVLLRQLDQLTIKRTNLRQELDTLATRDESLQKNKNSGRMKVRELENAV